MQSLMLRDDQSRSPEERPRPDRPRSDCPVLLSQRLVLRAPHIEDIDALAHLANNAAIATMVARSHRPEPGTAYRSARRSSDSVPPQANEFARSSRITRMDIQYGGTTIGARETSP